MTWKTIMDRRNIKQRINTTQNDDEKAELQRIYGLTNKQIRKSARADKRRWYGDIATQAQKAADSHNNKETNRHAKLLANKPHTLERPLRSTDDTFLTTDDKQTEAWTDY